MMREKIRVAGYVLAGMFAGITLVVCGDGGPGKPGVGDAGAIEDMTMGPGPGPGCPMACPPTKTILASEDANQIQTGTINPATSVPCYLNANHCVKMASGPFILTDILNITAGGVTIFVGPSDDAINQAAFKPRWLMLGNNVSGLKLLAKSGENLYVALGTGGGGPQLTWSGYQPY